MKTVLEYLNERLELAQHNRLCYSENYAMSRPRLGFEKEWAEAARDIEIAEELIAMVKEKEAPAKQTPPSECPAMKLFRELDEYIKANDEKQELREEIKREIEEFGIPQELTIDHGNVSGSSKPEEKSDGHTRQNRDRQQAPVSGSSPRLPGELERFYQRVCREFQEAVRTQYPYLLSGEERPDAQK